jgi:hypothetical protein
MPRNAAHPVPLRLACPAAALVALATALPSPASDHADPIHNTRRELGLTDLFAFPTKGGKWGRKGDKKSRYEPILAKWAGNGEGADRLVLILCTRPSLAKDPPYRGLNECVFKIHMDLGADPGKGEPRARLTFDNPGDRRRYGGTVENPELIRPDVTITIRLNDDTTFMEKTIEGKRFRRRGDIQWYSGVRDDPFIFPMFFGTNVIAVVISIPFRCFPEGQQDWLIWATSSLNNKQVDHVGRSQRTQLPRFDFLNTLPPSQHVQAIRERRDNPGLIDDVLRTNFRPLFNIRPYDLQPDVMVFTKQKDVGFPNGRWLTDDVAKLTCEQGDCQLFELSFAHPKSAKYKGGRPTENDKEFLNDFPYLAEPWPDAQEPPPPELTARSRMLVALIIAFAVTFLLLPWVLYAISLRRQRALARQLAAQRSLGAAPPPLPGPAAGIQA